MPKKCINPCSLSAEEAKWLPAFFKLQLEENFWSRGVEYRFKDQLFFFEYPIIRRACHDAARGVRYEVVDDRSSLVGAGGCGKVYPIVGTLRIDEGGLFQFKTPETDPKHKLARVAKIQRHTPTKNSRELAKNEYDFADVVARHLSMKEPTYFSKSEHEEYSCLVMRRQPGTDLFAILQAEEALATPIMTTVQRFALTKALIQAFGDIAQKGAVHGDVKPENVMVDMSTNPPSVRTIDLALAHADGSVVISKSGTRCYTAPELLTSRGIPLAQTTKMDVFSLGLVLALLWGASFGAICARDRYPLMDSDFILAGLFSGLTDLSDAQKRFMRDLLKHMLQLEAHKRLSFEEALTRMTPKTVTSAPGTPVAKIPISPKPALHPTESTVRRRTHSIGSNPTFFWTHTSSSDTGPDEITLKTGM